MYQYHADCIIDGKNVNKAHLSESMATTWIMKSPASESDVLHSTRDVTTRSVTRWGSGCRGRAFRVWSGRESRWNSTTWLTGAKQAYWTCSCMCTLLSRYLINRSFIFNFFCLLLSGTLVKRQGSLLYFIIELQASKQTGRQVTTTRKITLITIQKPWF